MVGGFCGKPKGYNNDEYFTLKSTWELIKDYIPKDKKIWESFKGNGQSATYLKELGFDVECYDEDFFNSNHGEIIITNCPFSKKKQVLEYIFKLDKPFIMIMPCEVMNYKYLTPFHEHLQLIIPKKRMKFLKDNEVVKFNYDCIFFCWKMSLKKDLIFL